MILIAFLERKRNESGSSRRHGRRCVTLSISSIVYGSRKKGLRAARTELGVGDHDFLPVWSQLLDAPVLS